MLIVQDQIKYQGNCWLGMIMNSIDPMLWSLHSIFRQRKSEQMQTLFQLDAFFSRIHVKFSFPILFKNEFIYT